MQIKRAEPKQLIFNGVPTQGQMILFREVGGSMWILGTWIRIQTHRFSGTQDILAAGY